VFVSRQIAVISICVAGSVLAYAFRPGTLGAVQAVLAIAIIWVGLAPGIWYLRQPHEARRPLPVMALSGLFYAVFFGLPAFLAFSLRGAGDTGPQDPRIAFYGTAYIDAINVEALFLVLAGQFVLFSTWLAMRDSFPGWRTRIRVREVGGDAGLMVVGFSLALGSIAYGLVPAIKALPSVGQFLQPAGYVAFAILYLLNSSNRLPRPLAWTYFLLLLPIWGGLLLASGFLTSLVNLLVLWFVLRLGTGGSLPWKPLLVAAVLFPLIYAHINSFRNQYWVLDRDASIVEKVVGFVKIVPAQVVSSDHGLFSGKFETVRLVRRISLILPFSHVVESTPEVVPYWQGATYRTLFVGWVPRIIWRNKPEERWGNEFGRRYEILMKDNRTMSTAVRFNLGCHMRAH